MKIKIPEKILWFLQRFSAIIIFSLFIWFFISTNSLKFNDYYETIAWIKADYNIYILFILVSVILIHANLGLSVIIDDYIHSKLLKKITLLIKNVFIGIYIIFSGICLYFL